MADYCTVADVKALAGAESAGDDALLATLVARASALVDTYTRRAFTATTTTRYYSPGEDTHGLTLFLDADLLSITTLTNGDGEEIASGDYALLPLNTERRDRIKLKASSGLTWTYDADPEGALSVAGTWGYSTTPPADIVQATARLALWLYRQREAPFGKIGNTITGEYEIPVALPSDVKAILNQYKKSVWGQA